MSVAAAMIGNQAVGDLQEVRPGLAFLAVAMPGLPSPLEHFLAQIVGRVGVANPRQQESSHGPTVLADPLRKPLVVAGFMLHGSHVYHYERGRAGFIAGTAQPTALVPNAACGPAGGGGHSANVAWRASEKRRLGRQPPSTVPRSTASPWR